MHEVLAVLVGTIYGTIFSFVNYKITINGEKKMDIVDPDGKSADKEKNVVLKIFLLRFIVNVGSLLAIFFIGRQTGNYAMFLLVGAVVGLTLPGRWLLLRHAKAQDKVNVTATTEIKANAEDNVDAKAE